MPRGTDRLHPTVPASRAGLVDPVGERARRIGPAVLLAGGVLALSVLLHVRDPHRSGSWGLCPWLMLTGTYCPACGGLRAVNDLTDGDLRAAASSNLLFVMSIPVVGVIWARTVRDRWCDVRRVTYPRTVPLGLALLGLLAAVFVVARNTGAGAWLAP